MEDVVVALVLLLTLGGALYGLHRLTLPPARREKPEEPNRFSTAVGSAAAGLHSLLNPGARHVIEIKREQRKEQDGSGEPPTPEGGEENGPPPSSGVE